MGRDRPQQMTRILYAVHSGADQRNSSQVLLSPLRLKGREHVYTTVPSVL